MRIVAAFAALALTQSEQLQVVKTAAPHMACKGTYMLNFENPEKVPES
jgi:hypothetical protein